MLCKLWFPSKLPREEKEDLFLEAHYSERILHLATEKIHFPLLFTLLPCRAAFCEPSLFAGSGPLLGGRWAATSLPPHMPSPVAAAAPLCGCCCPLYFCFSGVKIKCSVSPKAKWWKRFSQKSSALVVPLVICFGTAVFILSFYYESCFYSNCAYSIFRGMCNICKHLIFI